MSALRRFSLPRVAAAGASATPLSTFNPGRKIKPSYPAYSVLSSASSTTLLKTATVGWQSLSNHDNTNNADTRTTSGTSKRFYFTNADEMKKNDPYAQLGLQWGDATSTKDIQEAFRKKARELHPDVNQTDSPAVALRKFQNLQKAYETLLRGRDHSGSGDEGMEEWRFAVWRGGDRIAQDRTDVAGVYRKRPAQPASKTELWAGKQLGHPDGRGGVGTGRAEFLGAGSRPPSSSVGTGQNKWVTPKNELKPWNLAEAKKVRASNFASQECRGTMTNTTTVATTSPSSAMS